MAGPLRLELAGGLYHITARGDGREAIYLDDADRIDWLALLGEVCTRFQWRCLAYCLMTNHYHILVETPEPNLARGMRQLNGIYTQRFNRRHVRVGHVFQGRYKAILVERDSHLLELARYVVLNPVRAGMVARAEDWPWSSYRACVHLAPSPPWLDCRALLAQFSGDEAHAISRYATFVLEGIGQPSPWGELRGQIYLGSEDFVRRMQRQIDATAVAETEIPRPQRRAPPSLETLSRQLPRDEAMIAAYASGAYTLAAIARHFGVHYSTVSRVVRREMKAGV